MHANRITVFKSSNPERIFFILSFSFHICLAEAVYEHVNKTKQKIASMSQPTTTIPQLFGRLSPTDWRPPDSPTTLRPDGENDFPNPTVDGSEILRFSSWGWYFIPLFTGIYTSQVVKHRIWSINSISSAPRNLQCSVSTPRLVSWYWEPVRSSESSTVQSLVGIANWWCPPFP